MMEQNVSDVHREHARGKLYMQLDLAVRGYQSPAQLEQWVAVYRALVEADALRPKKRWWQF